MTPKKITVSSICSIVARVWQSFPRMIFYSGFALTLGAPTVAHAVMGESAENRGLVLADEKDFVLLACTLGAACQSEDDSFFRRLPANQIVRNAATIEAGITIPPDPPGTGGIGFGSLLSTDDSTDTFCWTGDDQRECVEIFGNETPVSDNGVIIDVEVDTTGETSACAGAEALFGQPAGTFDYLVRFDTDLFGLGQDGAVVVVTCAGVAASPLVINGTTIRTGVVVTAHRSMSAYDALRFGGGYCCR